MLTHFADGFTAATILAGLWAALLWWRSGRVQVKDPSDVHTTTLKGMADPRTRAAVRDAIRQADKLNSRAAVWTAVSVAAQAIATILGRLATPG